MSFGKSKTKSSQQGTSQTTVNPWSQQQFTDQSKGMMDAVNNYTSQPFKPYTGQMVAGLGAGQQTAKNIAGANVGQSGGILDTAISGVNNAMGYDGTDVSRWYNPYEKQVVDATGAYMDQGLQQNLSQNNARATQAGAFGGSRHGVADAELMRNSGMDKAKMMADLRYQGYGDARNAGFQNQQAQYQGAGLLAGLGNEKQASWQRDADYMAKLGATDRDIEQMQLLAQRAEFDRSAKDQYDKLLLELQTRQGILGATPITTNTNSTGSSSGSSKSFGASFGFGPSGFSVGGGT
ncbi:hypothetical protein UFOVP1333_54 [uncultured Caudovirales phage]|uniref:Uncharacterized protein n=1 Tax=uncultured Caudovirales phage TaxID=2100421 RepID=A0A6J5RYH5_9CAUD|nr:hypothetical protein UFOVP1333_54 [uncultured Caudovirales phage]